MKSKIAAVAGLVLLTPAMALAQWSDNFDSYPSNTSLNGLGGWSGWDNTPSAAGATSDLYSVSGPNSMAISAPTDAVQQFTGITSGAWTLRMSQYIPRDFSGMTYVIMLNRYGHNAPDNNWSMQLNFDSATGLVVDNDAPGSTVQFIRGEWVDIRVEIDLDADTIASYYNEQLVGSGTWTSSGASSLAISALDMFGNNATPVYYDNMSLMPIPAPGAVAMLGLAGMAIGRRRR